jgi:N-glycosidase YbiA
MQVNRIDSFRGQYRFLSNFSPAEIYFDDVLYSTVEHAYQAAKTLDLREREQVQRAPSAGDAKRLGRKVTKRDDWEQVKVKLMRMLLRKKFEHPVLADMLLETGDAELIEGNTWGDTFWGQCGGRGENWLGRLLMQVRDELKARQ